MDSKFIIPAKNKARENKTSQADKDLIDESGLFDEVFYTEQVESISNDIAPIEHFLIHGASNLLSPSKEFDSSAYVEKYKDVKEKAINPLLHYLKYGVHEGRQKISVSVPANYNQLNSEAGSLKKEEALLFESSSYFDEAFYVDTYADLLEDYTGTPIEHYVEVGVSKNLKPSLYFDTAYYLKAYPDVKKSGQLPLLHYIKFGEQEGRQPNSSVSEIPCRVLKKWAKTLEGSFPYIKLSTKFKIAEYEKRLNDAENHLREIIELESESAVIYSQLAAILRHQGKWWQEVEAHKSAIELEDQHATWHYRLGEAQEVMNRFQQAAAAYADAIELKKGKVDAEWYYRQGYCHERKGHDGPANLDRAKQAYQQAINKDTKLDSKRFGIGVFHQKRGHWVKAAEAYARQFTINPLDAELSYRLGMAYDRCYEWEKAEHYYTLALGLEIDKPDWHYRLGFVRERQRKHLEASEAYQYAALTRNSYTPYWFYRWGYVLEQAGEYQQACDAFLQTRKQPTLDTEVVGTAQETLDSKNSEQEVEFDTLPAAPNPLEQYKQALLTEHQVARINKQLEEDCTSPALWYRLGNVYERQQQWQLAADAYQHALARKNNHIPEWYFRLSYVLTQQEKYIDACEYFRRMQLFQRAHGVSSKSVAATEAQVSISKYAEFYECFSLDSSLIVYESWVGSKIGCNPYAIFRYIKENYDGRYKHVFVVDDISTIPVDMRSMKDVFFIRRGSELYLKYLASAGYLINNTSFPNYFIRKEGQRYLNTWHGTPQKKLGIHENYGVFNRGNPARNFVQCTHIISPNEHTTNALLDGYDARNAVSAKVAETGYPRIDLTFNMTDERKSEIINMLGIDVSKPVVLYAPTWRGDRLKPQAGGREHEVIELFSERNCNLIFRGHFLAESMLSDLGDAVSFAPASIDTNELMFFVDVLITDYSSIYLDFIATGKRLIHYIYDYEEYASDRGLYFGEEVMPGTVCKTYEDLFNALEEAFDNIESGVFIRSCKEEYVNAVRKYCLHEDGESSKRAFEFLMRDSGEFADYKKINEKNPLLFGGHFKPNGITSSFISLVSHLDESKENSVVVIDRQAIEKSSSSQSQFNKISDKSTVLAWTPSMVLSLEERYVLRCFNRQGYHSNEEMEVLNDNAFSKEFLRNFGVNDWGVIINFHGYSPFWSNLFASNSSSSRRVIYCHSLMCEEHFLRFPELGKVFQTYKDYDAIVSVSSSLKERNEDDLIKLHPEIEGGRFSYVPNMLNVDDEVNHNCEVFLDSLAMLKEDEKTKIITVGRLSPEKGQFRLVEAAHELLSQGASFSLYLVGDGPDEFRIRSYVERHGLMNSVFLLGYIENPYPLLECSDCFVLPSLYEGQGLVILEALSAGIPAIATDSEGPRSILSNGNGLLVENSVQGLKSGVLDFLNGKVSYEFFDINEYNFLAKEKFLEKVVSNF